MKNIRSALHKPITSLCEMLCTIWYHLYNLKNVKNNHGGVLLLVKLQSFTKSNTPPWVFLMFFYIIQMVPNREQITISINSLRAADSIS